MSDDIAVNIGAETPIVIALTTGTSIASGTLDGNIFHFQDVRAASIDYIHLAIVGNGAVQIIATNITNPDKARNASITATNVGTPSGVMTINGINIKGIVTAEEITIIPGATAYGNVAWVTITSIILPSGVSALDTIKIGISDKIGLPTILSAETSIIKKTVNDEDKSSEIAGNVNTIYCTLNCAVISDHSEITVSTKPRTI